MSSERPLLFVGRNDYPPMAFLENGAAKGMNVDLANALAKSMKREVRVELMDWSLAQKKVLHGEADGLLGLSFSEENFKSYDFAKPTFTHEFGFVVRNGETIRDSDDLRGKKVGIAEGGFPRKFLETQPGVTMILIQNYSDGLSRLTNGTLDVLAADLWVAGSLIKRDGLHGVSVVERPVVITPGAIAIKKENVVLLNQINQAIANLETDGTIEKIQARWRPPEMVAASHERIRHVFIVLIGTFLGIFSVAAALWFFAFKKRREFAQGFATKF